MAFLGATPAGLDPEAVPQTHSNKVNLDESAMPTGVALYAAMAERLLRAAPPRAGAERSPS
jgi:hippurate hydrolase